MKFLFILSFVLQTAGLFALDVPYLSGRIVDEVGVLNEETANLINEKLKDHEFKTSNQVVVLIIPSLEGEILEEYSLKVASAWKLGQKDKNNGVLFLIAMNDRKLRIEVGYGLEGVLTDALCSRIIRNEITPSFKQGNFSGGIENGVNSILGAISGTYLPPENLPAQENTEFSYERFVETLGDSDIPLFFRIPFGLMFAFVITPFTIAAAVTPYIGWFLYFFLMPFYATFPLVFLGKWGAFLLPTYVIVMFFAKLFFGFTKKGKEMAEKVEMFSGSGSGSSGSSGGSFSGSFGGGGFSGGGGSFGGGGSSGSW